MAEIAAAFLGPAIEVVKCVAAPIKRQFNYFCCFKSNVQSLRVEAEKLVDAEKGLQIQVDRAEDNLQVILPEVKTWLRNSNDFKGNVKRILDEVSNIESGCLRLGARFSLGRRAKKTTDLMEELRGQCKFNIISQQGPPAATSTVPLGTTFEFESRKEIEEDIMASLRQKDVNMIGICGMGGVGKTTMAKRVMNRALEEHLFDEIVMVVISQKVDELKIQLEIGGSLGLRLEGEAAQARVQKLHARLSGTKRILLVLDDVWKSLALEDLGIPCIDGFRGCTILLTSRNRDVLKEMTVEKICGLHILSEGEAWFLFREKAGTCVDDTRLNPTAKEVMKECNGLPIALATVGMVLRDENDISIWEDALRQLRKSNPLDIPNILTKVYNPLKLSYDFLDNERAKSIFLLCCLFPEDDDIPVEHLTYFAMGLRVFEGIRELEEARGRTRSLIKMLKNRFLLLDGSDEHHIKMHDVVRDVSIFIASEERSINCSDCAWISSFVNGTPRLPAESGLPNLRLLFLDNRVDQDLQVNDSFIEETRELNVLFIRYGLYRSLPSSPHSTQLLKCLGTLVLYKCDSLGTISVVGQFVSLEILICRDCDGIKEVPVELKGLKRLRRLEISICRYLRRVAPGVISSLVGLEELRIDNFNKWELELEDLANARNVRWLTVTSFRNMKNITTSTAGFPLLEFLALEHLDSLEEIWDGPISFNSFKNLKELRLEWLPALKQLGKSPYHKNFIPLFSSLSSIFIDRCPRLRCLFSSTTAKDCLSQLETIKIKDCDGMEQVFLWNEEDRK